MVRFGSYRVGQTERAAVLITDNAYDVEALGRAAAIRVPPALGTFIEEGALERFRAAVDRSARGRRSRPPGRPRLVCPLRRPPKIWGIGLNYRAHARPSAYPFPRSRRHS